jgi:DNA-directed RNA polymerase subunit RPC12/RpoP
MPSPQRRQFPINHLMNDETANDSGAEIVCPHCRKPFNADLMEGDAERYRGFKCPNCRLFVPAERAS